MANESTLLSINGIDFSAYASRGISCTLSPIATGSLRRDVTGTLQDLTLSQFRKYRIEIACTDLEVPDFRGSWRGQEIEVTILPDLGLDETAGPMTLTMMVDEWHTSTDDEWEAFRNWRLTALEI